MSRYLTAALYKFVDLPDFATLREPLLAACENHQVKGTLLLAREGINGTIAGPEAGVRGAAAALRGAPRPPPPPPPGRACAGCPRPCAPPRAWPRCSKRKPGPAARRSCA